MGRSEPERTQADAAQPAVAAQTDMSRAAGPALTRALERLVSLQDGDLGVLAVVAFGAAAVAPLQKLLFAREPSGLYQPRCRVVDALAALGARDVLRAFVQTDRDFADPVEVAGEEAVLNAALRALRGEQDDAFFQRVLTLAATKRIAGAIELLGGFRRPEALPCLVAALADDVVRPTAEGAIRRYGRAAVPALVAGATERIVQDGAETESSRRRRRAALDLLAETGGTADLTRAQRALWLTDDDPAIVLAGSRLVMADGTRPERQDAARRLLAVLPSVNWPLRSSIERFLIEHPDDVRPALAALHPGTAPDAADLSHAAGTQRSLLRLWRETGPTDADDKPPADPHPGNPPGH